MFIRRLGSNGEIQGILVHDNREKTHPVTYIAEKGILAQTPAGTRLIMLDGTIETSSNKGAKLQVLHFESDTINMDQFSGPARATVRKIQERYLGELLWPSEPGITQRIRDQFFAEAHYRLSQAALLPRLRAHRAGGGAARQASARQRGSAADPGLADRGGACVSRAMA